MSTPELKAINATQSQMTGRLSVIAFVMKHSGCLAAVRPSRQGRETLFLVEADQLLAPEPRQFIRWRL
jgi:hypothetical protein